VLTILKQKLQALLKRFGLDDAFSKSVAKLAGGAAIGQVLTLGASPILARLYAPSDFGTLGVFASITSIATMFAALRYEQAIPLAESDNEAKDVALLSFCVLLTFCVISFGFLSYTAWMGHSLIDGLSPGFMLLLPLSVFAGSMYRILVNLTIRARDYGPIAATKLYQSIGQVVVQLSAGCWRPHPLGLIAGFMVSQGGGSLTLFTKNKHKGSLLKNASVASVRSAAKKYKEFPMVLSWATLLNSASMHLPGVLIANYYGVGAAGLFYLSRRVLGAPMILLRTSVSQVFLGEASSLYREDPEKLKTLFHSTSRKLLQMGSLVCIPAAIVSPYLFPFVFGENWAMAGKLTQVLAVYQLFQFTVGPMLQMLLIMERRKVLLLIDSMRFCVVVLSLSLPFYLGQSVLACLVVYSLSASLFYILNYFYVAHLVRKIEAVEL
jgi:O-antigen/teichoic acid export membrane protein